MTDFWTLIWGSNIANNVKSFFWKAGNNLLPTCLNLHRKVWESPSCKICQLEAESIEHILWECSSAQNVLEVGCCMALQKSSLSFLDSSIYVYISRKHSTKDIELFLCIARNIWLRHNSLDFRLF